MASYRVFLAVTDSYRSWKEYPPGGTAPETSRKFKADRNGYLHSNPIANVNAIAAFLEHNAVSRI